jgi:hypothetical protein
MGISGYLGIVIAVLVLALAGAGWALKGAYKEIGAFELAQEANTRELQKATDKVAEIKALREIDQQRMLLLAETTDALAAERDAIALKMDKWRSTLDARTLAKPEVTRRAARRSLRVAQCKLWRDTGGVGDCPK